ncbi:TetR/AcrR family transcriptional regulator [Dermatobacter hominis]|uniref:TetR/AcrR family transcriptional regulator n=1 Tax=Dermatobacter hominis TaxID=2884263 RepID=UPI001D1073F0|nr:TetR/AcrR family transcriptional regulator [Dermatobacter hominis]UDY37372.1 TetR/AcrR family transcriptional regulator [Dermatobacter hominis]
MSDVVVSRRGRPRLTDEERAGRRRDLTVAAIDAIRAHGADQSLDELAGHLGVSKPVLYDVFGSRAGLADAVAVELADRMQPLLLRRIGPPRPDGSYPVTVDRIIEVVVESLLGLVEQEDQLYLFVAGSIGGERHGLLDNALVQVVHERIRPVIEVAAPTLSADEHTVLTDGIYGLVLATLESWQTTGAPSRDVVVRMLSTVIREGLHAIAEQSSAEGAAE